MICYPLRNQKHVGRKNTVALWNVSSFSKTDVQKNENNTGTPSGGTILNFQKQAQESGNHSKEHNWEKTWLFFQKNQLDLQK